MRTTGHLMGWRNENCWPLAWVVGFSDIPSLEVGQVGGEFGRRLMLDWLPNNVTESRELRSTCELRDAQEVHVLEDLFYCAHNAVQSAQLGEDTVPEEFDPMVDGGCIHERRHALTWVLSTRSKLGGHRPEHLATLGRTRDESGRSHD